VFVHDRQTDETICASVNDDGQVGNARSLIPRMTADGAEIFFWSSADNLDGRTPYQSYVFNMESRRARLAVRNKSGNVPDSDCIITGVSADGRFLAIQSWASDLTDEADGNRKADIYVRDRKAGRNYRITMGIDGNEPNGESYMPSISSNGRWVAFSSDASNLVEDDTNDVTDAFLVDFLGCTEPIRGDANCDGVVDVNDIDAFVTALIDSGRYALEHLLCDWECNNGINRDGSVDFNDIDGFIECLIDGGCP
jgi:hypothetical protein